MGLTKRILNNGTPALPLRTNDKVPRRSSDGFVVSSPRRPTTTHRNLSISTSTPSSYEYSPGPHMSAAAASPWMTPAGTKGPISRCLSPLDRFLEKGVRGYESNPYKKRGSSQETHNLFIFIAIALFLLPWAGHQISLYRYKRLTFALEDLKEAHQNVTEDIEKKTGRVRTLEATLKEFQVENHRMLKDLHASGDVFQPEDSTYKEMEGVEDKLLNRIYSMRQRIQEKSKNDAEEKFGEGPHRVEVTLRSGDERLTPYGNKFVIEMAPLDVMPHSVNHFLKMVDSKLWDGLSFVHRDLHSHVLQATPLDVQKAERVDDRFYDANLGKLSFCEYSPKYPHRPYTVGFAGRPGGPDFYINTVDNSASHGPNEDYVIDEGESCFGSVVSGRKVLDDLLITEGGVAKIKLVEIESIRLK